MVSADSGYWTDALDGGMKGGCSQKAEEEERHMREKKKYMDSQTPH